MFAGLLDYTQAGPTGVLCFRGIHAQSALLRRLVPHN
jgi:hypothetical protein